MLAILLWERAPSQWDLGFLFDFLQLFQGGAQGDFPPWDRMMASRHMRAGLSFREQGVLFDSWGRRARLVAVGGWQSRWRLAGPPGTQSSPAPSTLKVQRAKAWGLSPPPASSHSIRSGESGDLDFTSAKMSLSCLFNNKPHECFSSLIVTLGSYQNFKKS